MNDTEILSSADAIYLDSSAMVKLIKADNGPAAERVARGFNLFLIKNRVPLFTSAVTFAEYLGTLSRDKRHKGKYRDAYLSYARSFLKYVEIKKLQYVEPPSDKGTFAVQAHILLKKYPSLEAPDIWHIMATKVLAKTHKCCVLFSFDRTLVKKARNEGLQALDANELF